MIDKVEIGRVNRNTYKYTPTKNPHFGSGEGFLVKAIQKCEKNPMMNVAFLDLSTAIVPRSISETIIGSQQTDEDGNKTDRRFNWLGGFEAFRRESSGLLINCLIPGFIVKGIAHLVNKPIMGGFKNSNLAGTWANSDSIGILKRYYDAEIAKSTDKNTIIKNTLVNIINDISGIDGKETKKFKDFVTEDDISDIAKKISEGNLTKEDKSKFYSKLVAKTGVAENIKLGDDKKYISSNLGHLCDSTIDMLDNMNKDNLIGKSADTYFAKAKRLINIKSIGGLGVVLALALSAQPINRWITHKISGKKGAPLYNDDKERILTLEEKTDLNKKKAVAIPLMWGVTALSMILDKPSLKMFQFKSIFPTMDQARLISAFTFSSRLAAAEDANELEENKVRDIATFASFYFLGDYVAKGIASIMEKKTKITLTNKLQEIDKDANPLKKIWNWAKHTKMKSSEELEAITDVATRTKATKLRAWCQVGNLLFSMLSLGVLIPLYTRTKTNKREQQLKENSKNNISQKDITKEIVDSSKKEFLK